MLRFEVSSPHIDVLFFMSCFQTCSLHAHFRKRSLLHPPLSRHPQNKKPIYDSVVTLAFALVTLTPSCLALARISTLFLADTEWEILFIHISFCLKSL